MANYVKQLMREAEKARKCYLEQVAAACKSAEHHILMKKKLVDSLLRQQSSINEYDRLDSELSKELLANGWFFSLEWPMRAVFEFSKIKKERGIEGVIKEIVEYFSVNENIEEVYDEIIKYPLVYDGRKYIVEEAFTAHKNGRYNSSVPLFLIQAEGIYNTWCGVDKLKPSKVKKYFKNSIEIYSTIINDFDVFINSIYRSYGLKDYVPPSTLNRHLILHGRSIDYGTLENSIKSILFVQYILGIVDL